MPQTEAATNTEHPSWFSKIFWKALYFLSIFYGIFFLVKSVKYMFILDENSIYLLEMLMEPIYWLLSIFGSVIRVAPVKLREPEPEPKGYLDYVEWRPYLPIVMDYWHYGASLITTFVTIWVLISSKSLRRVLMRMRGVCRVESYVAEAMQLGSGFMPGKIHSCQIPVFRGGILGETFVGYAIRISNEIIAMPYHVEDAARPMIIIGDDRKKYDISENQMVKSAKCTDLRYFIVPAKCLVDLRVSIARFPRSGLGGFVSVSGREGTSSGTLSQHLTPGMMYYEGSTKAGYSGAPYYIGNQVYGIHLGDGGNKNVGLSYIVLVNELLELFKMQRYNAEGSVTFSSPSVMGAFEELYVKEPKITWSEKDFVKPKSKVDWDAALKRTDLWADEEEEEYAGESAENVLQYLSTASISEMERLEKMIQSQLCLRKETTVKAQGEEEKEITISSKIEVPSKLELHHDLVSLTNRFEVLEKKVAPIITAFQVEVTPKEYIEDIKAIADMALTEVRQQQKNMRIRKAPVVNEPKYYCTEEGCNKNFAKLVGIIGHLESSHGRLQEEIDLSKLVKVARESAIASDESDIVGNGKPFFRRVQYQKKKAPNYVNGLNRSVQHNQFRYLDNNRKSMEDLQKKMEASFEKLAASINGLISATQQKLDH